MSDDIVKAPGRSFPNNDIRYGPLILPGNIDWRESLKRESLRNYELGNESLSQNNTYMSLQEFSEVNGDLSLHNYWIFEHYGRWFEYNLDGKSESEFPVSDEFIEMVKDDIRELVYGDEAGEIISSYRLFFQKAQDGKIYYFYRYAPNTDSDTDLGLLTQRKDGVYVDSLGDKVYYPRQLVHKLNQQTRVKHLVTWMVTNKRPVDLIRADELHESVGENPTRITIYLDGDIDESTETEDSVFNDSEYTNESEYANESDDSEYDSW
jgi:hypothetical protein